MNGKKAANDAIRPVWTAEAAVLILQARQILSRVENSLVKQDDSLRAVPLNLELSIKRIRRAIRIVSKGLP
jgi:hypothetical protein